MNFLKVFPLIVLSVTSAFADIKMLRCLPSYEFELTRLKPIRDSRYTVGGPPQFIGPFAFVAAGEQILFSDSSARAFPFSKRGFGEDQFATGIYEQHIRGALIAYGPNISYFDLERTSDDKSFELPSGMHAAESPTLFTDNGNLRAVIPSENAAVIVDPLSGEILGNPIRLRGLPSSAMTIGRTDTKMYGAIAIVTRRNRGQIELVDLDKRSSVSTFNTRNAGRPNLPPVFSNKGGQLFMTTSGWDGPVDIVSMDGEIVRSFNVPGKRQVSPLTLSGNDPLTVVGTSDGILHVFSWRSWGKKFEINLGGRIVQMMTMKLTEGTQMIAVLTERATDNQIHIVDPRSGEIIFSRVSPLNRSARLHESNGLYLSGMIGRSLETYQVYGPRSTSRLE